MVSVTLPKFQYRDLSLKTRLVVAFASVVLISGILSSVVYSFVLVATMKKSTREKIEETAKVAIHQIDQKSRGLEIYADLIGADITFGQVLSFDISTTISQKIEDFKKMSQADVVAFVPRPEQYVNVKDQVFVNQGNDVIGPLIKNSEIIRKMFDLIEPVGQKGWLALGDEVYLLSMKPVMHFGLNMGVIVLAQRTNNALATEIAKASGAQIMVFSPSRILGTSIDMGVDRDSELPHLTKLVSGKSGMTSVEGLRLGRETFFSLFTPIQDIAGKPVSYLSVLVSNAAIRDAQNKTLGQVLLMAALATILSAGIGYILARAIAAPLHTMTGTILSIIEKGDLGIRITGNYGGEQGILTRSFNRLVGQLQEAHEKLASSERRMKHELTTASTVQEMLFPARLVRYDALELASYIESSSETGGDWFGYSENRAGKQVSVMIGDVTGHGMPAALITAITNGFFKGVHEVEEAVRKVFSEFSMPEVLNNKRALSTADLLFVLNELLLESTKGSLLMTFFASLYDPKTSHLLYSNAGHNRPFVVRKGANGGGDISILTSPPSNRLGETAGLGFVENSITLDHGDVVLWYTDGLLECENPSGEMYGKRRLMNILRKAGLSAPANEILEAVLIDARTFYGNQPKKDDITLVVGKLR